MSRPVAQTHLRSVEYRKSGMAPALALDDGSR
jgi:hypothetical protein